MVFVFYYAGAREVNAVALARVQHCLRQALLAQRASHQGRSEGRVGGLNELSSLAGLQGLELLVTQAIASDGELGTLAKAANLILDYLVNGLLPWGRISFFRNRRRPCQRLDQGRAPVDRRLGEHGQLHFVEVQVGLESVTGSCPSLRRRSGTQYPATSIRRLGGKGDCLSVVKILLIVVDESLEGLAWVQARLRKLRA